MRVYNENMPVTISQFRKDLFKLADSALEGKTVEFTHKGVVFKVVPEHRKSKLSRIVGRPVFAEKVDLDEISKRLLEEMQAEWEKDWAEL